MTFDYYVPAVALGRIDTSDLPDIATELVANGYDSPAFVQLAGVLPGERTVWEIDEMWKRGVSELGHEVPTRRDAALQLRRYYAARVVAGELAPADGASEIVHLSHAVDTFSNDREWAGDGFGIAKLYGLFYKYDDVPEGDRRMPAEIDEAIRVECARLAQMPDGVI